MIRNGVKKEISGGMLPAHVGNATRIFRRYLDIPHVRLHSDSSANFVAAKLNAEAFTIGRDVFFASGKLNLSTPRGVALLRHELTHVEQQERQSSASNIGEMRAPQYEVLENEALANEGEILSFLSAKPQTRAGSLRASPIPQSDATMITRKYEQVSNLPLLDEPVNLTHIHSPQIQTAINHLTTNGTDVFGWTFSSGRLQWLQQKEKTHIRAFVFA